MSSSSPPASLLWVEITAALYVLSGVCQPLLMTIVKETGLADPTAQLYLVAYYLGPSLVMIPAFYSQWPPRRTILTAMAIAILDVFAQALNYTGNSLAGPTIFAIIYSSVTVWTAVWARIVLRRTLTSWQWVAVCLVFVGLTLTATDSWHHHRLQQHEQQQHLNILPIDNTINSPSDAEEESVDDIVFDLAPAASSPTVIQGTILVLIGSALHAGSYVWSEFVLTGPHALTVQQNTGLQCLTACLLLTVWQCIYTIPRWSKLIGEPLEDAESSMGAAIVVLVCFGMTNLIHATSFFFTIKHYKGGSVMAGVFKGLQAVLVFLSTDWLYCGHVGGMEMCFTRGKFWSLVTVVSGVVLFSVVTKPKDVDTITGKHGKVRLSDETESVVTEESTLLSSS